LKQLVDERQVTKAHLPEVISEQPADDESVVTAPQSGDQVDADMESRTAELEAREAWLRQQVAVIQSQRNDFRQEKQRWKHLREAAQTGLDAGRTEIEKDRACLDQDVQEFMDRQAALAAEESRLEALVEEIEVREQDLAGSLSPGKQDRNETVERLRDEIAAAAIELKQRTEQFNTGRQENAALQAQLEEKQASSDAQREQLQREIEQLTRERDELPPLEVSTNNYDELSQKLAAVTTQLELKAGELEQTRDTLADLEQESAARQEEFDGEVDRLSKEIARLELERNAPVPPQTAIEDVELIDSQFDVLEQRVNELTIREAESGERAVEEESAGPVDERDRLTEVRREVEQLQRELQEL